MKKLSIALVLLMMAIEVVQAYGYDDYIREDAIRTRYNQERFDRMMENSRRSSAIDAMYSMQQNDTMYRPHIPTTDYSYQSTQVISKPLDVFGRY